MNKILSILLVFPIYVGAQSYPPPAGQPGSTAIHKDSSIFIGWATNCTVQRGYMNVENQSLGYASFGVENNAIGPASGVTTSVVSIGDGGTATLTFDIPIANGAGPDFAVFENGLNDEFLEIGFVEVSSNGTKFVRFPAISEVQTTTQIGGFGTVDCRYIHNFAGKYRVGFGTPFDLEDIKDSTGIDINHITHVRIVDVIGSIDPLYATYDSQGTIVNNLHPTPFESGGFDLDAVGIINTSDDAGLESINFAFSIYPNPVTDWVQIYSKSTTQFKIYTTVGAIVMQGELNTGSNTVSFAALANGVYFIQTIEGKSIKFVKE
ncbi:MAG: T9SS type A sorting domain-containing protein [Crocinitomicaceae bacterium]|nr:T9SS type A sorting domain-containing protein [Crocinitomicaceae bacterium]